MVAGGGAERCGEDSTFSAHLGTHPHFLKRGGGFKSVHTPCSVHNLKHFHGQSVQQFCWTAEHLVAPP
eukprot:6455797-Amphidinium_carterae.1